MNALIRENFSVTVCYMLHLKHSIFQSCTAVISPSPSRKPNNNKHIQHLWLLLALIKIRSPQTVEILVVFRKLGKSLSRCRNSLAMAKLLWLNSVLFIYLFTYLKFPYLFIYRLRIWDRTKSWRQKMRSIRDEL